MKVRRMLVLAVVGAVALAGCSSAASKSGNSSTTTSPSTSTSTTTSPSATTTPTSGPGTTTTSPSATTTSGLNTTTTLDTAENLADGPAFANQLIAVAEAAHGLPSGAYKRILAGSLYAAVDPATGVDWAGAKMVPSSLTQAQVSVQDDGGYMLFMKPAGKAWKVMDVGMTGIAGSKCPVVVPPAILQLWYWKPGTCRQPGS